MGFCIGLSSGFGVHHWIDNWIRATLSHHRVSEQSDNVSSMV